MSNSANRYYAEGVIKELWMATKADAPKKEDASETGNASETEVRFTLTPDKEYTIEAEHKGEKKTCVVFRPEGFAKDILDDNRRGNKKVGNLYAGDFTFFVPKGMTFDQLLPIKINGCHIRITVESKDVLLKHENGQIPVSEIRLKQK